jgi:hypothetical protein
MPEETKGFIHYPLWEGDVKTCRISNLSGKLPEGIRVKICQRSSDNKWKIKSFLFSKNQNWTMAKAKAWVSKHRGSFEDQDMATFTDVPGITLAEVKKLANFRHIAHAGDKDQYYDLYFSNDEYYIADEGVIIWRSSDNFPDLAKKEWKKRTGQDINVTSKSKEGKMTKGQLTKWTQKYMNDLPDSSFALVKSKVSDKSKDRALPYKDVSGKVDLAHLRNALARLPLVKGFSMAKKSRAKQMLERILASVSRPAAMEDPGLFEDKDKVALLKEGLGKVKGLIESLKAAETIEDVHKTIEGFETFVQDVETGILPVETAEEQPPAEEPGEETPDKDGEEKPADGEGDEGKPNDANPEEEPEGGEGKPPEQPPTEPAEPPADGEGEGQAAEHLGSEIKALEEAHSKLTEANNVIKHNERVISQKNSAIAALTDQLKEANGEITTLKEKLGVFENREQEETLARFGVFVDRYCEVMKVPEQDRASVRKELGTFSDSAREMIEKQLDQVESAQFEEPVDDTAHSSQQEGEPQETPNQPGVATEPTRGQRIDSLFDKMRIKSEIDRGAIVVKNQ